MSEIIVRLPSAEAQKHYSKRMTFKVSATSRINPCLSTDRHVALQTLIHRHDSFQARLLQQLLKNSSGKYFFQPRYHHQSFFLCNTIYLLKSVNRGWRILQQSHRENPVEDMAF